jgi:ribosomal protein S18 acetylase RimI-like enzyme
VQVGGVHVAPLERARLADAYRALARAFVADPAFISLWPIDAAFPADRPWYLAVVGVASEAQERGLGTRLLGPGLDRCDAAGGDCYLETDTAAAARLYARLGVATLEAGAQLLPGGPTHWWMRRPAGGAPGA